MAGQPSSDFQKRNWGKHSELISGRSIQLYGKEFNASYDFTGQAKLEDLVRFTITFGTKATLPGKNGRADSQVMVAYVPQTIGSGVANSAPSINVPCSGVCLISYTNAQYKHSFPVMDQWVTQEFRGQTSNCRLCNVTTGFGHPICASCYASSNWQWDGYL